ncbi:DUF4333 domain-containing protein [Nocardia sp. NPDC024068]|uniref:DUF4333 domain-containing protein n=1 Tax=Nocardia sp. NPDC024068 TaxID=3157197 RepID=UPI0033E95C40
MSGPYGPNDAPGTGEGRNDPTQVWGGQQPPGAAPPWGSQQPSQPPVSDPQQAQATQQWGDQSGQQWGQQPQPPQQQWSQPQPQPDQPQPQQWGDPNQQQWGQQPQGQWADPNQQPQQQWADPNQQQWGQQPQGQWGQPQQQWAGQPQSSGGGKKVGLFIGLGLLAVVVVGAVVGVILMLTSTDQLDQAAVQDGVAKVLEESYGIEDVKDVQCPSGQDVAVDATFTCDLKVGGEAKTVNIKITKEDGTYEVGRPS